MACTSCSESVERALQMVPGVKKAAVGLALEEAKVHYDPNITSRDLIIEAVEDAGFGADLISSGDDVNKVHLKLEGLNSPEDTKLIQTVLETTEGVNHVEWDTVEQTIKVAYDPDITGPRLLIQCIQNAAQPPKCFNATLHSPPKQREAERNHEIRNYRNQFLWSCLFSVPVFLFSMVLPMISPYGDWLSYRICNNMTIGMLLRWLLCSPVQFIVGWRFYIGAYHALKRGYSNMDVLVALGTNAAYFYSVYIVLKALTSSSFEGQDFFETSAMLVSFILLGKYLEVVAKGKTSDALSKLTELAPETACLLSFDKDGNTISETEISTQLLQRNDVIKIVPGTKVPVDGVVIKGQSHVNESMITGEARPIAKKPGDRVIGGTVNDNGCIIVKATHVGSETALSQIVQLVEAAQLARAPVQKLADKISRFFVPTVVVAAFLTWLGWFIPGQFHLYPKHWIPKAMDSFELALQFGISVLVVACPCALGLATPTAVMVATGKGASQGVLIKGGNALEKAHKIKAIIFDKTGTLTVGKPSVVQTKIFSKIPLLELCDLAAGAEVNSEHPLSKAIVEHTKKLREQYGSHSDHMMESRDFEVHPGAGVSANVEGKLVLVGNKRLMQEFEVELSPEVEAYMSETEELARTCILVAIDKIICGALAVSDPLKPEAGRVISYLKSMGISSIMVTGDNWATAKSIAKEVGISQVFAEIDPVGKAEKIKDMQVQSPLLLCWVYFWYCTFTVSSSLAYIILFIDARIDSGNGRRRNKRLASPGGSRRGHGNWRRHRRGHRGCRHRPDEEQPRGRDHRHRSLAQDPLQDPAELRLGPGLQRPGHARRRRRPVPVHGHPASPLARRRLHGGLVGERRLLLAAPPALQETAARRRRAQAYGRHGFGLRTGPSSRCTNENFVGARA
ncbi:unnamed protein product [Urochloa decumbens]|uniref:P-type Cu(+) transporter n=1 Tax=Urochloa decumbens TaxID=240449 RepID=A0ABC8VES3_9POAL